MLPGRYIWGVQFKRMIMKNKKQIGIWLDYREAFVVELREEDAPVIQHLRSGIEPGVYKGGVRSKTPYGPQVGPNEQRFEEKRHHHEKAYFEKLIDAIDPEADQLIIFGPAEAKFGLQNAIEAIKHYRPQVMSVFPAEAMSENQIVARVKEFFEAKLVG